MKYSLPLFSLILAMLLTSCGASKELTAEVEASKSALAECRRELNSTQSDLEKAKALMGGNTDKLNEYQMTTQTLEDRLAGAQAALASTQAELNRVTKEMEASSDNYGVWFRVQIGAYGKRKIDPNLQTTDQLSLENMEELQKTALGRFRKYDNAKELKDHLVSIGLKDAWIVSYKDGKRVPIEEALKN